MYSLAYNSETKSFAAVDPRSEEMMKAIMNLYPKIQFFKAVEPFDNAFYANKQLAAAVKTVVQNGGIEDLQLLSRHLHITIEDMKSIKGEFIVYGKKFADVYTLSHELGHHHHTTNGNIITKGAHNLYGIGNYRGYLNLANFGLAFWKHKKIIPFAIASNLALSLPQLTAEAAASNKGIKILKNDLKLDKSNIKEARKDLRQAYGTYAIHHLIQNLIPISIVTGIGIGMGKESNNDLLIRRTDSETTKLAKKIARQRLSDDECSKYKYMKKR